MFRHGEMNNPLRAINTFQAYFNRARRYVSLGDGFQSLELGPGDSVLSGIVARAYGAEQAWLVDVGNFAETDLAACSRTVAYLSADGKSAPKISGASTLAEVLDLSRVRYLTAGVASLKEIPTASIDFIWSQVVLEHIHLEEFQSVLAQLRRVAKPTAVGIHAVDFRDHLGGRLNNLRFSRDVWESWAFQNSGFYTNRIRPRQMIRLFEKAGFLVEVIRETRWDNIPIRRHQLASAFARLPDEELAVAEFEIATKFA